MQKGAGSGGAEPYLLDAVGDGEEEVDPGLHLGLDGRVVQVADTFLRGVRRGQEGTEHRQRPTTPDLCGQAASILSTSWENRPADFHRKMNPKSWSWSQIPRSSSPAWLRGHHGDKKREDIGPEAARG